MGERPHAGGAESPTRPRVMSLTLHRPTTTSARTRPAGTNTQSLTDQAARWADHVLEHGSKLSPSYVTRKALDAVAFSLRHGLRNLAVPTKLVGVKAHQHAVEALSLYDRMPVRSRPRLAVTVGSGGSLTVSAVRSDGSLQRIGRIQPKHVSWLTPLLDAPLSGVWECPGVTVHLQAVTGLDRRARGLPVTLGVNVRVSGLGAALDALRASAPAAPRRPRGAVAEPPAPYGVGGGLGAEPSPPVLAVRLWRDADGVARMTCPHVVRHSPSGPEWGYGGSGPADCARSVLVALVGEEASEAHYQAFKAEVVARVPEVGAVISRAAVLAWLAGREHPATPVRPARAA